MSQKKSKFEENLIRLAEIAGIKTNLHVVKVIYFRQGKRSILRVTLDKEGGVTLDDCTLFSRAYSKILDEEDPIKEQYCLEVQSPGI